MKRWLVYFGFALLALFLSGGASFASCSYKPEACDNKNLCLYATDGKDWSSHGQYKRHVTEAKSRGLSCGFGSLLRDAFISLPENQRKLVQSYLRKLNYYKSSVDGLYGRGTEEALRRYNKVYLGNPSLNIARNADILISAVEARSGIYHTSSAGCSYKPEACDDKSLCLLAAQGKSWSSHGQYKRHVVEAKSRGLSCGIDFYDALSALSFQELLGEIDTLVDIDLSASIQNQMIRLGCLKSDQRNNYDGTKSFNSLEYIFNFDQSLERSFVSYDNINFLFYLQSKENNYCRRTVTVFWDEDYSRAVFARFMNFVRLGINSDIRFEYQDPPLLYDFETPIAWETPTLKETDYIIKIKIEKKEGSGFDAKMRVYDVSTKKEIKKGLIFSTPKISNESMRAVSKKIVDNFLQNMTARQVKFKNLDKFLDDEHLLLVEKIKEDISRVNLESAMVKLDELKFLIYDEKIDTEVEAELLLLLGKKYSELGEIKLAARTFLNVFSTFENSIYGAEALFLLGNSLDILGQTDAACKALLQVQLRFPGSDYNIDATKMMTELKCL